MKDILDILGSQYPLNIGAMAHISTSELGIPAIKAGLGFSMTMVRANVSKDEWVLKEVEKFKEAGIFNFGLNILMADNPRIKEDIELVLKIKPRFVTLSAVLKPEPEIIKRLNERKIFVGILVGSLRFTDLCLKILGKYNLKPDFFIAEGRESGGHIGPQYTENLLKEVIPYIKEKEIPVGVAGGIYNYETAQKAFKSGADFVQIGSVVAVSKESPAHPDYKKRVFENSETVITGSRWLHAVRALKSPFTEKLLEMEKEPKMTWEEFSEFARGSVPRGLLLGDWENGTMLIGEVCKHIKEEKSINEIKKEILGLI